MRAGICQFDALGHFIENHINFKALNKPIPRYWDMRKEWLDPMKTALTGFSSNASYGVGNSEVSDGVHIAYDMMKTVEKTIATEENHDRSSVWHHGNICKYGSEPIIKIEKEQERK